MLGFGLYGSRTEDRVVLVIVLELSFNRRKLSLGRLGGRLGKSFNSLLYVFLLLRRSGRTSHSSTGSGKTCSSQQTRGGTLFSSLNYRLFSSFGSCLSLVRSLLLSEFSLQLTLDSLTFSLNRVNTLNSSFLRLILRGSLSGLSGRNGLSLNSGTFQQEALANSLTIHSTQVRCVNLQAITQARLQRDSRTVPGCADLLSLGVQCRNGCKPVNTGHDNAGFNLTAAVQQTVVHILINLAQFQAHGARTAGAHKLRKAVESTLLGERGQGCRALNGLAQDDGFGNQFSFVFAELLLSFLQLSNGLLSGVITSSRLVLLCFLLIDALCGQRDALRGTLFGLLLSLFSLFGLCGRGNGSCSNYGGSNSGGVKDQLCGVLFFSVEVLSRGRFRDGHVMLLLNGYGGEQLGLIRDRVFFLSKFRCQQLRRLNDSLNRLFLSSGSRLYNFFFTCGEVNGLLGFEVFSSLSNSCGYLRHIGVLNRFSSFSGLRCLSSCLVSSSFLSDRLIGSNLYKGLLFAVQGDAQACRVGCRQIVQTGVLRLGHGGMGAGCLHIFNGMNFLSFRCRMSVLSLVLGSFYNSLKLFAALCLVCSICIGLRILNGSILRGSIFGVLSTQSTQVLLKMGTCILCSVLRLLLLDRCVLSCRLFVIAQERGGSRLSSLSNRGFIFFNVLGLSYLLDLNRLFRFLRESTKRSQQATTLLFLSLILSQLISSGRFFNLLIAVQEGALEVLNSAVLFVLLFIVVLVACAFRLHEAAQGVLPLLLFHNLLAQSRILGSVFAYLFLLDLSSFGALFFARLLIQLLLADSKEAHWVSSSGVRRVMMRHLLHPPQVCGHGVGNMTQMSS